jgi:hypothetical protein
MNNVGSEIDGSNLITSSPLSLWFGWIYLPPSPMLRHEHKQKVDLIWHPRVIVPEATASGCELTESRPHLTQDLDSNEHPLRNTILFGSNDHNLSPPPPPPLGLGLAPPLLSRTMTRWITVCCITLIGIWNPRRVFASPALLEFSITAKLTFHQTTNRS